MRETPTNQDHADFLMCITLACIAITAGISSIALMGWTLKWLIITRISTDYIPMAPSTAASFFILSITLLIYIRYKKHPFGKTLSTIGAVFIFSICFIILATFLTGSEFDIEQIVYPNPEDFGKVPIGRMSPLTAINFLFASSALLFLFIPRKEESHAKSDAAFLATIEFLIGFLIMIGYWYGSPLLYGGTIVPTAINTAIAFVFLSIGTITAIGLEYWPIRSFIGESVNARLMRAFLPITVALILIQGWLSIVVFPISRNHVLSTTLVALLSVLIIGFIVMKIAQVIGNDIDLANDARTQAQEALQRSEHRLIRAQEVAHIGDWEFEIDTNKFTWSDELNRIYGIDPATELNLEFVGKEVHPEDSDYFDKQLMSWIKNGEGEPFEYRIVRPDGAIRDVYLTAEVVRDNTGHVVNVYGTMMDNTKRKQMENEIKQMNADLEQRVAERTSELTAVIKEIEAFSYSISHDLRTPLRSVAGFSQVLLEDYGDKLDETGRGYLQRASNAAQNMDRLIDDLLNLSRIARDELRYSEVNLSGLVSTIANKYKEEEPERKIEFIIAEGLKTNGDEILLKTMFDNLISNACKFTSQESIAKIEFGTTHINDENVYYMRDNGVGFDLKYADKLFGAYQRLHSKSEFPGTGIGLAVVQRIIHKHGGHIWAKSKLGEGTTFYFTI